MFVVTLKMLDVACDRPIAVASSIEEAREIAESKAPGQVSWFPARTTTEESRPTARGLVAGTNLEVLVWAVD